MTKGLLTTVLCAFVAASCSTKADCRGDFCGTIVIAIGGEPETLFPPASQTTAADAVADLIFLKLADIGPGMNSVGDEGFLPRLAESWEWEDSVTLVFNLNQLARWHDGAPVRAEDVEFTFAVYTDTVVASPKASVLERISSVTPRNNGQVEFKFRLPYPEQFYDATHYMRILPRHVLDTIPRVSLTSHPITRAPVGSGPYRLVSWRASETIELVADSNFFLGRPGLARVIFRVTPDMESALAQVLAGEADVLKQLETGANVDRFNAAPHLRTIEYPSSGYTYLQFNMRDREDPEAPHPLFRNRMIRRALAMAVNQQELIDAVLGGLGDRTIGPVSKMLSIWNDQIPSLSYDTTRALELLNGLGWTDTDGDGYLDRSGRRLEFELAIPASSRSRRQAAVVIQDQLRRIGVDMVVAELELNTLISRVTSGRFDVFFGSRTQDPSPSTIREAWSSSGIGGANFGSYSSSEFDRLIDSAIESQQADSAMTLWHRAVAHINADAPAVWLYSPNAVAAVHRRIEGVTIRPDQWTATLWTWRIPESRMIARDRRGAP